MVRTLEGKHHSYYEAILQLREASPEIVSYVQESIARNNIPLTKVKEVVNGIDYYLADGQFTKSLGRELQQKFGGQNLVTASLVGRKKEKDLYRLTVLFRGISFKKGDIINYRGEKYEVKSVGKDIIVVGVENKEKKHLWYKEIKNIKVINE